MTEKTPKSGAVAVAAVARIRDSFELNTSADSEVPEGDCTGTSTNDHTRDGSEDSRAPTGNRSDPRRQGLKTCPWSPLERHTPTARSSVSSHGGSGFWTLGLS